MKKILCMHGGLSPDLTHLDQIRNLKSPTDVPESGLLYDLLWSDPSKDVKGWGMNDRGVSFTFGADKVTEYLQKLDLDLICRAHQVDIWLFSLYKYVTVNRNLGFSNVISCCRLWKMDMSFLLIDNL